MSCSYTVVRDQDKWRITVTDENGETVCTGLRHTEAEAWASVRYLRMDADKFKSLFDDVPRKYQMG